MKTNGCYYVGLDVHKRIVAYCVKTLDGRLIGQGKIDARPAALVEWARSLDRPWSGTMEATLFSGWIYDTLSPLATRLTMAHPQRLKAITTGKKKSDRIDAAMLCDLHRVNMIPECYVGPRWIRDLRRTLRYRNFLVQQNVTLKNKTSGLLMECGVEYEGRRLHGKRYFSELLGNLEAPARHLIPMLRFNHEMLCAFDATQRYLLRQLGQDRRLQGRVERLETIAGVGPVMALMWALEIGDPKRFGSIRKAVSYCGLTSRFIQSAGVTHRAPLSKQRNKHLQWALIEVSKMAPRHNAALARVHQQAIERGHSRNEATLAVARKLVAYLMAVDKSGKPFVEPVTMAEEGQVSADPQASGNVSESRTDSRKISTKGREDCTKRGLAGIPHQGSRIASRAKRLSTKSS
jgi:transposase